MKAIKYICILFLLVFSAGATHAQQDKGPKRFSLAEAVDYAKKNNLTLKNSQLDQELAEKKVKEVRSIGLPQVNASSSLIHYTKVPAVRLQNAGFFPGPAVLEFPQGIPYVFNNSITLSQLLFDGSFFLGLKAAYEYVDMAQLSVHRSEIETETNVSKAYYLILLAQANHEMIGKNLANIEKTSSDLNATYKAGFSEKIDVDRIGLVLSNLRINLEKTEDNIAIGYQLLKMQMGLSISDSLVLTDDLSKLEAAASSLVNTDTRGNYDSRVEYRIISQVEKMNNFDRRRYEMSYLPSLNFFLTHQENNYGIEFSDFKKYSYLPGTFFGFSANIPLFDGLRKSALIQQSRLTQLKTRNDKQNLERAIEVDRFTAKTNYLRARQQSDLQKKNMELAEQIRRRAEIRYKEGVGSGLELSTE